MEEFSERRPELIYIAGTVVDAEHVETALSESNIDYAMNIESFINNSFFGGTYPGVFFYVSEGEAQRSREYLNARGFTDTVTMDEQGMN